MKKWYEKPFWIILIFCIGLLLVSNQVKFFGGVCGSSDCYERFNESAKGTIYDIYGESITLPFIAPTGFLIEGTIKDFNDDYDIINRENVIITFDKTNEEFVDKRANEKHLYNTFIIIKLLILLNLIFWIPLGWLFYKFYMILGKHKYILLIIFGLIVLSIRYLMHFSSTEFNVWEVWLF